MVVIVLLAEEPWGPASAPRLTHVSCVIVNEPFLSQDHPSDTIATTKEEEWVSKKKTEKTTRRQIETRVQREVVLQDGRVVEDSGPRVTTSTTEDTETQEHQQTELRRQGDDDPDSTAAIAGSAPDVPDGVPDMAKAPGTWVSVANPDGVVREVQERRVISREETEQRTETEDIQHLGDITDKDYLAAVHLGLPDIRPALLTAPTTVVSTGPQLVHSSERSRKVTDTEVTAQLSSVRPDGKIVTETRRTTEHEEVKDRELGEGEEVEDKEVESSQRYLKSKDQELVEYVADGVKVGEEMRYKAETCEGERRGAEPGAPGGPGGPGDDWDSLSTRMRRQRRQQAKAPQKKGVEEQLLGPPLDRKDALTKKPLDFDEEEETRKAETSKWLENHFGSESTRSSRDSLDEDEPQVQSKSFFNVTIKSQPTRVEPTPPKAYIPPVSSPQIHPVTRTSPVYTPSPEPERPSPVRNGYYQGISEWSERRHDEYNDRYRTSPPYQNGHVRIEPRAYRLEEEEERPVPPERRRAMERRQRSSQDSNRYDSGYRTHSRNEMSRDSHDEPQDEPPPDYSPPPPEYKVHREEGNRGVKEGSIIKEYSVAPNKKTYQKTRFATDPPRSKPGNIIGQSIRKLVGKIRSASAERRNKQRAKRSPSPPTYQQYNANIDNIPRRAKDEVMTETRRRTHSPVQRYYLGEDPFGGSIYGRENKYDGVRPARNQRHRTYRNDEEGRSQSTLGRFSKSTGKLVSNNNDYSRSVQTLPRNIHSENGKQSPPTRLDNDGTINVSIINTVNRPLVNGGPAKPARTYKSALTRSKSFNVHAGQENGMYKSNPHLHRLEENPIGLKSPGIVSMLSRSQKDLSMDENDGSYTSRYVKNGYESTDNKKVFMKGLKERAPELFKTLNEEEDSKRWSTKPVAFSTPIKPSRVNYNDIYEPPTRLKPTEPYSPTHTVVRRGSNSTDDYSETYHITSQSNDPKRPSVTNTVQSFSKKTVPTKNGRSMQTIESTETRTVTKSRFREPVNVKYIENGKYDGGNRGVVIEVKNYRN